MKHPKVVPGKGKVPLNRTTAHTAPTKYGMGTNYGTGVRAKLGKVRGDTIGMVEMTPKKLKTPPKSVA